MATRGIGRELVLQPGIQSGRLVVPGAIQVFQKRAAGNLCKGRTTNVGAGVWGLNRDLLTSPDGAADPPLSRLRDALIPKPEALRGATPWCGRGCRQLGDRGKPPQTLLRRYHSGSVFLASDRSIWSCGHV